MIIELVNAGKRVGITANSHKVITNLLSALCEEGEKTNTKLNIVQKPNETDGCDHPCVTQTDDNGKVLENSKTAKPTLAPARHGYGHVRNSQTELMSWLSTKLVRCLWQTCWPYLLLLLCYLGIPSNLISRRRVFTQPAQRFRR